MTTGLTPMCEAFLCETSSKSQARKSNQMPSYYDPDVAQRYARNNPLMYTASKLMCSMKDRAKRFGRTVHYPLTSSRWIAAWLERQPCCEACQTPFKYGRREGGGHAARSDAPSIDRIDNDGNYAEDNVALLCRACNSLKGRVECSLSFALLERRYLRHPNYVPLLQWWRSKRPFPQEWLTKYYPQSQA